MPTAFALFRADAKKTGRGKEFSTGQGQDIAEKVITYRKRYDSIEKRQKAFYLVNSVLLTHYFASFQPGRRSAL
jgi:hypothetical protein